MSYNNIKPSAAFNSLFLFSVQHFSWEAQDKKIMWCMDCRSLLTLNSQPLRRSDTLPYLHFGLTGIQTLGQTFVTAKVATLTPGGP